MKKIGVVTFHNSNNYGAILQSYALQQTCQKLGYDVSFINYANEYVKSMSPKEKINKYIKNIQIRRLIKEILLFPFNNKKFHKLYMFRKNNLNISEKEFKDIKEFSKYTKEYDYLITGSDQVWNAEITKGYNPIYFLDNSLNTKKISYAASTGGYNFNEEESTVINKALNSFSNISVREKSDKEKIEKIIKNKNVSVVLDPTLLLEKKEWEKFINKSKRIYKNKYILVYTVEENRNITELADYISNRTGYTILCFTKIGSFKNKYKSVFSSGIEDFLQYFYNAEYIVTNSFHGTVFSLIFKKEFFVINHTTRGKRIKDLLDLCNLDYRNITLDDSFNIEKNYSIDYDLVDDILKGERKKSIEFLRKSLV